VFLVNIRLILLDMVNRMIRLSLKTGGLADMERLFTVGYDPDVRSGAAMGSHCIADLWGARHLADAKRLTRALEAASTAAGATLLNIFLHEFPSSGGITGVALLAESRMSIHTWPEKGYAAIDIFMCGRADTRRALDVLIRQLRPTRSFVKHLVRGADPDSHAFEDAYGQRLMVGHASTREPPSAQGIL
jgi:S-adenosylmethionine decarboxylase